MILLCNWTEILLFLLLTCCSLLLIQDFEDWLLSCGPPSWQSCYWQGWVTYLLWLWNDGWNKIFYKREIAWIVLCGLWKGCKQGICYFKAMILCLLYDDTQCHHVGCFRVLFSHGTISFLCSIPCNNFRCSILTLMSCQICLL